MLALACKHYRTAAAQGVLRFPSSTKRTNAGNVWHKSNAPTAGRGSSNVSEPGRSSPTQQAQQAHARRGAVQADSGKPPTSLRQARWSAGAVFILKEGHAYIIQRKAATQACKTSARAHPPRRRAGKGAYDRAAPMLALRPCAFFVSMTFLKKNKTKDKAARAHTSRSGGPRRKGVLRFASSTQRTKCRECMARKQRTHIFPKEGHAYERRRKAAT